MSTAFRRVIAAAVVVAFAVAACAGDTGTRWTYAPLSEVATPTATPAPAATSAATPAPVATPAPTMPAEPTTVEPAVEGEARVIGLESTASLRFLQEGQPVPDIAVVPGETVRFRIDNTAGFAHNFYIGLDSELNVPLATTDVGLPAWETGIRELEWTVPDDITGLKFGCTIPGHYFTQQGTFSVGT